MNLQQTKEIILKWIKSCETDEQLDLMNDVVDRFIVNHSWSCDMSGYEYRTVIMEIGEQIQIQRKMVVLNKK